MALLTASNAAVLVQNRALQSRLAAASISRYLGPGDAVPALRGRGLAGEDIRVDYPADGRKTLLLVFSPHCVWCERNLGNWEAIVSAAEPAGFRVVGVSTTPEDIGPYLASRSVFHGIPVIATPDPESRVLYKLNDTPQTLVIDDSGRIERSWIGAFTGSQQVQAERFFGLSLPGLPIADGAESAEGRDQSPEASESLRETV